MINRIIGLALCLVIALSCAVLAETSNNTIDLPPDIPPDIPGFPTWIENVVVTFVTPTECYIEEPNRSSGTRVVGDCQGISVGDEVIVFGTLTSHNGERYIADATVAKTGPGPVIAPLSMNNRALGGAHSVSGLRVWDYVCYKTPDGQTKWEWRKSGGCPNTGLLVKTWGTVKNTFDSPTTGAKWFHLDDGSRVTSDFGDTGIIVYSDADVKKGQFVTVTGICATEPAIDMPDKLVRVMHTRNADDVQVLREPKPKYPFSDEFDGERIDWRWWSQLYVGYSSIFGDISLQSGWLKLYIPDVSPKSTGYFSGPYFRQRGADGDWDLRLKLRLELAQVPSRQGIVVAAWRCCCPYEPADVESDPGLGHLAAVYTTSQVSETPFHVSLNGQRDFFAGTSDTWHFSIRKRGNTLFGSVSPDGVTFSDETAVPCADYQYFVVYTYSCSDGTMVHPVSGYVDYFRITPVSE